MNIAQYIDDLREKPDRHKRRVALLASGSITGLIFFAWLSVILPSNTSVIVAESESVKTVSVNDDSTTPIATLRKSTAQVYEAVKAIFTQSVGKVNLKDDYTNIKTQVETGQITITPDSSQ